MSEWRTERVGDVAMVTDYVANGSFESLRNNITYRSAPDHAVLVRLVDHNAGWKGNFVYVDRASYEFLRKSSLAAGDIVIANVGANAGTVFRVPDLGLPMTLGPNAVLCRPKDENVLQQEFLYYFLSSPEGQQSLQSIIAGSAQPKFNKTDFRSLGVLVPPLSEQRAVAAILGALDDKIDLNRRTNETLETMARAIFKDWFVDFGPTRAKMEGRAPYLASEIWALFPDRLDDEERPEGWRLDRLAAFTELQNGFAFKSADWQEDGVPVVKIGSVKPGVVDLADVSYILPALAKDRETFRLNVGDVLVGLTGYVGETGRVPPTVNPPMLNQRVARFSSSGKFSPFVYACVRDPMFKVHAELKGHGSAQANVSTKDLLDYPVINPNVQIVVAFDGLVGPLFEKSLANLGEITELATTRDLLLPKLMSGEIRVKDAEKTLEAVI
jgi:type I restriction enzyme S subunit